MFLYCTKMPSRDNKYLLNLINKTLCVCVCVCFGLIGNLYFQDNFQL